MTTETRETYNGWTNYETWVTKLWMDNEEPTYRYWRSEARDAYEAAEAEGTFTRVEKAAFALMETLKAEHEEALPETTGFVGDLLNAAFGQINWYEIATSLVNDIEEEEEEEEADAR